MKFLRRFLSAFVVFVCFFAETSGSDACFQKTKKRTTQTASQQEAPTDEQKVLGLLSYFRERQISLFLREAQDDLKQGQSTQAIHSLQHLLERQEDYFVWSKKETKLIGLHRFVDRIFEGLKKEDIEQYHRLYAVEAQKIFVLAKSKGDLVGMQEVVRRFFYTPAGYRAVDYLASHSFDRGEFSQAAHYWLRLLESDMHQKKVPDSTLAKSLAASKFAGRVELTALLQSRIGTRQLKLGNQSAKIERFLKTLDVEPESLPNSENWPVAYGSVRRNRSSKGSLPYWKPHWNIPFQKKETEQVESIIEVWQSQRERRSLPVAVANSAVAIGEVIFVRDYSGISAIDVGTGKKIWFYECQSSLANSVSGENSDDYSSGTFSPQDYETGAMRNSVFGTLSADDNRVYFVDGGAMSRPNDRGYRRNRRPRLNNQTKNEVIPEGNSLLALPVQTNNNSNSINPIPLWTCKGKKGSPLEGAIFMGPPLPVDHRLYVVAEVQGVLKLACLRALDGKLLWLQGIGKVEQPIREDRFRHGLACTLAYSHGVVVCPTQTGLLVAVNAETGSLMWCHYCSDDLEERRSNQASGIGRDVRGHAGYLSVPMIVGSQVFYLPLQSMEVQSYDLYSGKKRWRVSREDGEYLGAAFQQSVLLVGRRSCRALAMETGSDLWNLPISTPSGIGVQLGSNYLLPLQSGRFSLINLETGRAQVLLKTLFEKRTYIGVNDPNSNDIQNFIYPENLIVTKSHIVSAGAKRVTAYFKSQTLLKNIEKHPDRIAKNPSLRLQVAELQILNHSNEKATLNLETLIAENNLSKEIHNSSKKLLQDLLYKKLSQTGKKADGLIAKLKKLSVSSQDKLNFNIHKSQWQLQTGQFSDLLDTLSLLSTFSQNQPILWNDDPTHFVSTTRWVAELSNRMYEKIDEKTRQQLIPKVIELSRQSLKSSDDQELNNFLALFNHWPEANVVREELARRLTKKGHFHGAEITLLRNLQRAANVDEQAKANSLLANFYKKVGFHWEVSRLLNILETKYASASVGKGISGKQFVEKFQSHSTTRDRMNQFHSIRNQNRIVGIESDVEPVTNSDIDVKKLFSQSRKSLFTPRDYSYHLSVRQLSGKNYLHVLERNNLKELGKIEIPLRHSYSEKKRHNFFGHFLPIGSVSQLQGFSILEMKSGKPVWKTKPFHESGTDEMFQVGPAGPSFCSFQSRQRLVVVDPLSGDILWQKDSLEPFSGLWADSTSGLIGDENVLVLFDRKRSSYTVYRTTSGEIVRRGKLKIDATKSRKVFGRLLFHFTQSPNDLRMRIWDPLKDEFLLDEPASSGYARTSIVGNDIVVLTPQKKLYAIHATTGKIIFQKQFAENEVQNLVYLESFADDERFYVCLQQSSSNKSKSKRYHHYYVSNSPLASVHFWGDLLAFDRKTGKQLWKRSLTERSLFRTNGLKFPFLVFASRVGDQQQGNKQTMTMDVIESKTGKTLTSIKNLEPDRFYRVNYLVKRNRLEIVGTKSKVLFNLDPIK